MLRSAANACERCGATRCHRRVWFAWTQDRGRRTTWGRYQCRRIWKRSFWPRSGRCALFCCAEQVRKCGACVTSARVCDRIVEKQCRANRTRRVWTTGRATATEADRTHHRCATMRSTAVGPDVPVPDGIVADVFFGGTAWNGVEHPRAASACRTRAGDEGSSCPARYDVTEIRRAYNLSRASMCA